MSKRTEEIKVRLERLLQFAKVQYEKVEVLTGSIVHVLKDTEHICAVCITIKGIKFYPFRRGFAGVSLKDTEEDLLKELEHDIWVELALGQEMDEIMLDVRERPYVNLRTIINDPPWFRKEIDEFGEAQAQRNKIKVDVQGKRI